MKHQITKTVTAAFICAAYNLYFLFLMRTAEIKYLIYIDFLIALYLISDLTYHTLKYLKRKSEITSLLQMDDIIYRELGEFENRDITEHDISVLEQRLQRQYDDSLELQDYVAKWSHELKLPLSASLIMNEKQKDAQLRTSLRRQLERMKNQVNMLLQGCRLQSPLLDLDIKATQLSECIRTSIKNNQFFLIQKNFTVDVKGDNVWIYTDAVWLVYILDQLISNAVKYSDKSEPGIKIWTREGKESGEMTLCVEDNGEGISDSDLRHIFEKGYVGKNRRNARYKSTGMGLYMAEKAADALDSEISVESKRGEYTRFYIGLTKCNANERIFSHD